ncbi:hypothetical protein JTB14_001908 [Gonioctena quinquepunctata]|nr:hypothetical protein JTB14_001908 [Gonioctena quinquepunctata]
MAPGSNERQRAPTTPAHIAYQDHHNKKYLEIVRKYSSIIAGQFFGHLHSDTFRVIYGENDISLLPYSFLTCLYAKEPFGSLVLSAICLMLCILLLKNLRSSENH